MATGSDGLLWVREGSLVTMVDVPRSTYQSWEAEGLVERPASGAYTRRHVAEAVVIGAIRQRLPLAAVRNVGRRLRTEEVFDEISERFLRSPADAYLELVIEPDIASVSVCFSERDFLSVARDLHRPRTLIIVPLAETIARTMAGFENNAETGPPPTKRARGRPRKSAASVTPLRREG